MIGGKATPGSDSGRGREYCPGGGGRDQASRTQSGPVGTSGSPGESRRTRVVSRADPTNGTTILSPHLGPERPNRAGVLLSPAARGPPTVPSHEAQSVPCRRLTPRPRWLDAHRDARFGRFWRGLARQAPSLRFATACSQVLYRPDSAGLRLATRSGSDRQGHAGRDRPSCRFAHRCPPGVRPAVADVRIRGRGETSSRWSPGGRTSRLPHAAPGRSPHSSR